MAANERAAFDCPARVCSSRSIHVVSIEYELRLHLIETK